MTKHRHSHSSTTFIQVLLLIAIVLAAVAMRTRSAAAAPAQVDLEFDGSDNAGTLNSFLATTLSWHECAKWQCDSRHYRARHAPCCDQRGRPAPLRNRAR